MKLARKMLILYAGVTVVILAAVGGVLFARFRRDRLEDLQRELLNQLKHIDFALTSFMAEADSDVAALAANKWVRTRQDQDFTNFLEADPETFAYNVGQVEQDIIDLFNTFRLTHPYVNSVYMGRENGSFVRSHLRAQPTQYDPRTRPWYILGRDNPGKVMRTAPYPAVTTPDVNIGVVTALMDDEGLIYGVVGADITLVNLTQYLSSFEVGHRGQMLLLDQSGTILASKDEALRFQPVALLVGDEADALMDSQEGVLPFATASGADHLFFYTSPHLGWKIAIVVPEAEIRSEIMSAVLPELAGLLLALLLLSGLTFAGLDLAVIRPLIQLHNVTRDIARTGDLSQQVESKARDEIGSLAASFNQMMLNIQQAQEALRRERDLAEALKDAAATLTTTLDFETVLDRILEQVSRVVPNEACNVMLIEEERVRVVRWLGYERFGVEATVAQAEFSLSQTPTFSQMASSKAPLLAPDVAARPDWQRLPEMAWLRSYAATPIIVRDRVIGFLSVDSSIPNFFQEHHLEPLRTFANYTAAAIENAQLYQQVKRDAVELEQRVAERTAELEIALDRAESADRLKSAFLASMSHELRTPLNSIIGFTGILLQGLVGPLYDEQQKQLGMVMHSARHLLALINDVLDISKIEAGELELASEPFDVYQAIQRAVQTVTPLADKKGLRLIVEVSPQVGRIVGDGRRVEQILINLINNAIKFTDAGQVRIRSEIVDGRLVTQVTDTGIGIRPEDVGKLFKPFRQIDTGVARRHEGTGLGLAICDRLVTMMGGQIGVESQWGAGSTFTFTLPTAD